MISRYRPESTSGEQLAMRLLTNEYGYLVPAGYLIFGRGDEQSLPQGELGVWVLDGVWNS